MSHLFKCCVDHHIKITRVFQHPMTHRNSKSDIRIWQDMIQPLQTLTTEEWTQSVINQLAKLMQTASKPHQ